MARISPGITIARLAGAASLRTWTVHLSRDFVVTADLIQRARRHDRSTIEHVALLIGALISYARPFRTDSEFTAEHISWLQDCLLALAIDLGADRVLHQSILQMCITAVAQVRIAHETGSEGEVHSFVFPDRISKQITQTLDLAAFEHTAQLMRLACNFVLRSGTT